MGIEFYINIWVDLLSFSLKKKCILLHFQVNCESILGKCLLGTLIEEESTIKEESEEETLEDEKLVSMTHEDSKDTLDEEEKTI